MQSSAALTYSSSGVDIDENQKANRLIAEIVRETLGHGVVSQPGFFSGAIRLGDLLHLNQNHLICKSHSGESLKTLQLSDSINWFACLDYFASTPLRSEQVLTYVRSLAELCKTHSMAILGGETAEMPGVIRDQTCEVLTHIFGIGEAIDPQISDLPNGFIYAGPSINLATIENLDSDSCLVMSTDGVGTKTVLAMHSDNLDCIIGDILGHSQGDIACLGAYGLGVCLYLGVHSSEILAEPQKLVEKAIGLCADYGLQLFELRAEVKPDIYESGQIDLCGTIVGLVNESKALVGDKVQAGQICIGIPSSGLHTNGFSLARKILERVDHNQKDELMRALMIPHRNYSDYVRELISGFGQSVTALAHITGGGLPENLIRVLPEGLEARLNFGSWQVPEVFQSLQRLGQVPLYDSVNKGMLQTFNMGIGMVVIVDADQAGAVCDFSQNFFNSECPVIGLIKEGNKGVNFNGI